MPIFNGNTEIAEIYYGNTEIAEIYHGSVLVYSSLKPGTVILTSTTPQSSSISVKKDGYYNITLVAGGGGGADSGIVYPFVSEKTRGGGSGGGIKLTAKLRKNIRYNYVIGSGGAGQSSPFCEPITGGAGGSSSFYNCTVNGGTGAHGNCISMSVGVGGAKATTPSSDENIQICQILWNLAGNPGNGSSGGTSVYNNHGAGGRAQRKGENGFIEIQYLGKEAPTRNITFNFNIPVNFYIDNELVGEDITTYTATLAYEETLNYRVEANGYVTQSGDVYVAGVITSDNINQTRDITLVKQTFNFTVNSNVEADITIGNTTVSGTTSTQTVEYGDDVSWEVSASGYITQNGNEIVTEDVEKNITLEIE